MLASKQPNRGHIRGYSTFSWLNRLKKRSLIAILCFVSGHPNVGKSSVLNGLVGHKVCKISSDLTPSNFVGVQCI